MSKKRIFTMSLGLFLVSAICAPQAFGQETAEVSVGVDLVSRYIWRGMNMSDAPSAQPSIALSINGFEVGAWGAYSLSNGITGGDEVDLWLGYGADLPGGGSVSLVLLDYYYPNAGGDFSDYHNYDHEDGPGAHVLEVGGSFTFPSVPLTLAGYVNFHNDEGHNIYMEAGYPVTVGETDLHFFAGATPGSESNPDYYGTKDFAFLNLGLTATKEISVTDRFSLPISGSWIFNPNLDIVHLVVGFSF